MQDRGMKEKSMRKCILENENAEGCRGKKRIKRWGHFNIRVQIIVNINKKRPNWLN